MTTDNPTTPDPKISANNPVDTCLWFHGNAEEAANFYVSLFHDAGIDEISHYNENMSAVTGSPAGSVMIVRFHIPGMRILALNGGPVYQLSPAASLCINCDTQEQIDFYWDKFCDGGTPHACGWVTDKFGLTWQINWSKISEVMHGDPAAAERMMLAMWQMQKIDIPTLQAAVDGA